MPKDLTMALLLDFYGALLTPKQFDMVDLYYNDDCTLAEIAQEQGITRQGVRAAIKKSEGLLLGAEEKLGLAQRFSNLVNKAEHAVQKIDALAELNNTQMENNDIANALESIKTDLKEIIENA